MFDYANSYVYRLHASVYARVMLRRSLIFDFFFWMPSTLMIRTIIKSVRTQEQNKKKKKTDKNI